MLHGRASLRPDDVAFTFTDYAHDPAGVPESLTWSQLSRRTLNVARELSLHASVGDRAVILAPQSLDYILAFLGSMQAGLIAVPLPLPHRGSSHERVGAVFADTSPSVVLTTSAVAGDVGDYVDQARLETAPKIVEIDSLNLDVDASAPSPTSADGCPARVSAVQLGFDPTADRGDDLAPQPPGEFRAADAQLLRGLRRQGPTGSHDRVVVALLPRHGFGAGRLRPDPGRLSRRADQSGGVLGEAGQVDASAGCRILMPFRRRPTSPSTWPPAKPPTVTWPDSTSAGCWASSAVPNVSSRPLWNASSIGSRTSTFGTT